MAAVSESIRPPAPPKPVEWMLKNLFSSWFNALLTVFALGFLYFAAISIGRWLFLTADWRPVTTYPMLFLVGQYPREELWRPGLSLLLSAFLVGMSWGVWEKYVKAFAIFLGALFAFLALVPLDTQTFTLSIRAAFLAGSLLIFAGFRVGRHRAIKGIHVASLWLLSLMIMTLVLLPGIGNSTILPEVPTTAWGGMIITLLLAVGGIVLSFPIGVLLAVGRRSSLPVVRLFSVLFIETVRGVPLVTILFMFSVILALFLPSESRIDRLVRALMGIVIFSAAYTAENVRGGLQAIPQGQVEAAKALGLTNFQITTFIVLPQALRLVIPSIVGQFISLFKDTTLVVIVGINDLLGIGKAVLNLDPEYIRLQTEVYLFVALVFWVFSYFMSFASQRLEKALGVGER